MSEDRHDARNIYAVFVQAIPKGLPERVRTNGVVEPCSLYSCVKYAICLYAGNRIVGAFSTAEYIVGVISG